MLQILSTSNETSTGTELVQNGNFSELGSDLILNGDFAEVGSDLVTNGDFSDAGINLVSNPNFTDTGTEEVTDGNFSNGLDEWTQNGNFTSTANQLICNVVDGGKLIYQEPITPYVDGKTYLYTFDIISISTGNVRARIGSVISEQFTTIGSKSAYIVHSGITPTYFVNYSSDAVIENISVKELGADWTVTDGGGSVTFGDSFAEIIKTSATPTFIQQDYPVTLGASHKLTYTVTENTLPSTTDELALSSASAYGYSPLDASASATPKTVYLTVTDVTPNAALRLFSRGVSGSIKITDISVQELGEGWAFTSGASITALGAKITHTPTAGVISQSPYLVIGKSYKFTYEITEKVSGGLKINSAVIPEMVTTVGVHTRYFEADSTSVSIARTSAVDNDVTITNITVQEVGQDWTLGTGWSIGEDVAISDGSAGSITQSILSADVFYKIRIKVTGNPTLLVFSSTSFYGDEAARTLKNGTHNYYLQAKVAAFSITNEGADACTITKISTEQLDPNDYWTLGTGWSIGTDKAISTVTGSNSDITQSILTAGKTYRTVYEIVDYDAGTSQAIVTGSDGSDAVALGTYTEDLTTTGTDFSIRSKLGTFDGAVSSVSVKQLGTYEDQSIYVTAADVQTIPQASVYYLVELTSMGSKNSLYFIPSSVVPNNGRYTKLNFTVISKDALPQPAVGIISFYDSVGGLDTYPMGFYEFRIYEQTSSTNLDPLLATGLLEKGFAFVRDFSGNMQELTDGFKEYNPALTQYVYSK